MTHQSRRHVLREAARTALRKGWAPIPVPARSKNPNRKGWQRERLSEGEIDAAFANDNLNLGVLLGTPSGGLVDIDLDCPEAIALAPHFLPQTAARFGRASAPISHWLYVIPDAGKTIQFRDPTRPKDDERAMLVELRATGTHSLVPPSIHPSGEEIEWTDPGQPAVIAQADLASAVERLAAASLLARHWPAQGARHDGALALAGGLLRADWSIEDAERFIAAIALAAGDPEVDDRVRAVASTANALADDRPATGWPTLATLIGEAVVKSVQSWLGITARRESGDSDKASGTGQDRESSQASRIVDLVLGRGIDLFHDEPGNAYASFTVQDHLETWPLRAKTVKTHLSRLYYLDAGKAPNAQAVTDALQVLTGEALFAGPERIVAVRLADHDGVLYLDMGDAGWRVIAIRPGTWSICDPAEVPIRFRRPRGMEALAEPVRAASLAPLADLFNVGEESDRQLIIGWLIGCLYPRGPRPVLQLLGEQGTAKSTLARILRSILDPNTVPLRTQPKEEGDLLIAAGNSLMVALDNLSEIKPWLSDALCRLATGGGLSKRELYTDAEEVLLDAQRPVLLTAISEVATASDLLDRCITVTLPPIPSEARKTEAEIALLVARARPLILGALLDAAAAALLRLPTVTLARTPRMADFATWVEAAAPSFGWEPGAFVDALEANRRTADAVAIEAIPLGPVLIRFMAAHDGWQGSATELLAALNEVASEEVRKERGWPKQANQLSNQLRRLAPNLRRIGLGVGGDRRSGTGSRLIILTKIQAEFDRHHRHDRHSGGDPGTNPSDPGADGHRHGSSQDRHGSSHQDGQDSPNQAQNEANEPGVTICDDGDDGFPPFRMRPFDTSSESATGANNDADPEDDEECEWTA
jgi:hypothetical protein